MNSIKIFVGASPNSTCAENQLVYEYSLKKYSSVPVEIIWMIPSNDPKSFWYVSENDDAGWYTRDFRTPFSAFRYGIAKYCEIFLPHETRVIYTDDDIVWLRDVKELFDINIPSDKIMTGKLVNGCEIRHCVSVIDVKKWSKIPSPLTILDSERNIEFRRMSNYTNYMKTITSSLTHVIDHNWNNFDGENDRIEDIHLLHLTSMDTNIGIQMAMKRLGAEKMKHWYRGPVRNHRRKDIEKLFYEMYDEAIESGYKIEDYIPKESVKMKMIDNLNYTSNNGFDVTRGQ